MATVATGSADGVARRFPLELGPGVVMARTAIALLLGCNECFRRPVTANVHDAVSSLWEQRAARNEALFREVNENIARLEERHGTTTTVPVYICECANADCTAQLPVDPETYRRVRENPRWFFVLPGHEDPQLERVVERHRDYLIVEKTGQAGEVAEKA